MSHNTSTTLVTETTDGAGRTTSLPSRMPARATHIPPRAGERVGVNLQSATDQQWVPGTVREVVRTLELQAANTECTSQAFQLKSMRITMTASSGFHCVSLARSLYHFLGKQTPLPVAVTQSRSNLHKHGPNPQHQACPLPNSSLIGTLHSLDRLWHIVPTLVHRVGLRPSLFGCHRHRVPSSQPPLPFGLITQVVL